MMAFPTPNNSYLVTWPPLPPSTLCAPTLLNPNNQRAWLRARHVLLLHHLCQVKSLFHSWLPPPSPSSPWTPLPAALLDAWAQHLDAIPGRTPNILPEIVYSPRNCDNVPFELARHLPRHDLLQPRPTLSCSCFSMYAAPFPLCSAANLNQKPVFMLDKGTRRCRRRHCRQSRTGHCRSFLILMKPRVGCFFSEYSPHMRNARHRNDARCSEGMEPAH